MRRMIPGDVFSVEDGDFFFGKNIEVDGKVRLNGAEDLTDKDGTPLIGGGGGGGGIEILDAPPADVSKIVGLLWTVYAEVSAEYWTGYGNAFTVWPANDSPVAVTASCGSGGGTFRKVIASAYFRVDPDTALVSVYDENSMTIDPTAEEKIQYLTADVSFTYKYVCNK